MIDQDHLMLYVGEDTAFRDELLTIYEEQLGHWLETLHADLSDEDWQHATHSLKGASRGIGAWEVGDVCENGELLVGKIDDKQARRDEIIASLHNYAEAVVSAIAGMRNHIAA